MIPPRFIISLLFLLIFIGGVYLIFHSQPQSSSLHPFANGARRFWRKGFVDLFLNPLAKSLGFLPFCVLPKSQDEDLIRQWLAQSKELINQTKDTLRQNPVVSAAKKNELQQQMEQTLENLVNMSWKLWRLRRLQAALRDNPDGLQEVSKLAEKLLTEMENSLRALQSIPLSLLKLELAEADLTLETLLHTLRETNVRMQDLTEARQQVQKNSLADKYK